VRVRVAVQAEHARDLLDVDHDGALVSHQRDGPVCESFIDECEDYPFAGG
jgi:hypothetical protein